MKLNELLGRFKIYLTNEEKSLLNDMDNVMLPEQFNEREVTIIENLVKKSIIRKVVHKGTMYLVKNESS